MASPPPTVSATRLDNAGRWLLAVTFDAATVSFTAPFVLTSVAVATRTTDYMNFVTQGTIFVVRARLGYDSLSATLTPTASLFVTDNGTDIITVTSTATGATVATGNGRESVVAGHEVTVDLTVGTTTGSLTRPSGAVSIFPGGVAFVEKIKAGMRVERFAVYGAAGTSTNNTVVELRKNTSAVSTVTATPSAGVLDTSSTISAGSADFSVADTLDLRITSVTNAIQRLTVCLYVRTAVLGDIFSWGSGTGGAGTNPPQTQPRMHNHHRFKVMGMVVPKAFGISINTPTATDNWYRGTFHRVVPSNVRLSMQAGGSATGGSVDMRVKNDGTQFASASVSGSAANVSSDANPTATAAFLDGKVISIDNTAHTAGSLTASTNEVVDIQVLPALLQRFTTPFPAKIVSFRVFASSTDDPTSGKPFTLTLSKNVGGTVTQVSQLTQTTGALGGIADDAIGSVGELAATDEVIVELDSIATRMSGLIWCVEMRPAFIDSPATYVDPAAITVEKLDNFKRRMWVGSVNPEYLAGSPTAGAPATGNNYFRTSAHRAYFATLLSLGMGAKGTGDTTTLTLRPGNQTASIAGAGGSGVADTETVLAQAYAADGALSLDVTAVATGTPLRPSYTIHLLPGGEIARWKVPFPCRITGFEVLGNTATASPSGTLDASLINVTGASTIKQLNTATASSSKFAQRDDTLSTSVAANDYLRVVLTAVPQGTVHLSYRVSFVPAVDDS